MWFKWQLLPRVSSQVRILPSILLPSFSSFSLGPSIPTLARSHSLLHHGSGTACLPALLVPYPFSRLCSKQLDGSL
ncbi:hypothetical protein BO82DRAFT_353553 [Aspergillus uvarum CBS 121591]|uniref:Uncharacterized protein n=1 Tax=Aspergillus uvarum CBS 121591 TaxID=1448315 RepID=A0A319D3X5_9EURO|nr:hypothetical protein BO82DRAFT_353553 [Aspergillus uvarum CBS 121591]PYH82588.1 hypothetical protein BO82DRAFT_353553 [Aspergillus uvarum CBS 121591]